MPLIYAKHNTQNPKKALAQMISRTPLSNTNLKCWQKALMITGSGILSLANPYRDDLVAALGELTGERALTAIRNKMLKNPTGRAILKEKPKITYKSIDFEMLRNLPKNSFGKVYSDYMTEHGISPDSRKAVKYIKDPELAFVAQRHREVHDFLHVLFGAPTNTFGELALKLFEYLSTGLPMAGAAALFGPLRMSLADNANFFGVAVPWAFYAAQNAVDLMCVRVEDQFEKDFKVLLGELRIVDFPKNLKS
ncbi:Ubiquinone biosynthesis protein [Bonamia ostreae]|uniref:Ubiquinone biosynthesis protein COQ4 homolog, mitochondrial n=1 Tax=Bonamia ostreae TaxID=126728 RepID=A0ABV2AID4_9EUKA